MGHLLIPNILGLRRPRSYKLFLVLLPQFGPPKSAEVTTNEANDIKCVRKTVREKNGIMWEKFPNLVGPPEVLLVLPKSSLTYLVP